MRELPKAGETYRHFKGKTYEVLAVARHTETMEELVIYRDRDNPAAVYARPMTMFMSLIDRGKYPDAAGEYRFERMEGYGLPGMQELPVKAASHVRQAAPDAGAQEEEMPEGVSRGLIRFLDEDDFEEKLLILDEIKGSVDDGMASAMAASLDLALNEGTVEDKLEEIRGYLNLQLKYDGKHLRERTN